MTIHNKLNGFEPVYVINLSFKKDRHRYIEKHFKKYKIKNYEFIDAVDGTKNNKEILEFLHPKSKIDNLRNTEIAVILSHLKTIRYWVETSSSEYAIICEDDVDLSTSNFWSFTWKEFINNINFKFDIIQMSITNPVEIPIHKRYKYKEYSAGCYLIKRSYAKKLINKYFVDDKYKIVGARKDIVADEIIYESNSSYSVGLFSYKNKESSINPDKINGAHQRSINLVFDYWKKNFKLPTEKPGVYYKDEII
jgi:hypothetical protein